MASLINPPLLDKTGKEIVAELTGETVQPSASQYNAPISDATGKAILEAIKKGGGGGGGGANVLTLYAQCDQDENIIAYKNEEMTQPFSTYEEAETAVKNSDVIKVYVMGNNGFSAPIWAVASVVSPGGLPIVCIDVYLSPYEPAGVYLYKEEVAPRRLN